MHAESHEGFVDRLIGREGRSINAVDYIGISMPRFTYTVALCKRFKPGEETKVLDIGRSYQSFMLARAYTNVTTLGLELGMHGYAHEYAGSTPDRSPQAHIVFNLNDAQRQGITCGERYDLIVFAEVVEHLHTAPELVLHALQELLSKEGLIVCLTPNAASLPHRLRLLRGVNPYERVRVNIENPGHYREYTKAELIEIGHLAGLETVFHEFSNFRSPMPRLIPRNKTHLFEQICKAIPQFALGQVIVYRKHRQSGS